MPELVIRIWFNNESNLPCVDWDGLIGTPEELQKYKDDFVRWSEGWESGDLVRIITDDDSYLITCDSIQMVEMFERDVR
jgi:hypothetical protein